MQQLRQTVTARDLALAAAESTAEDERRAAALQGVRLATTQAALQQREADFQALRTSLRWQNPACTQAHEHFFCSPAVKQAVHCRVQVSLHWRYCLPPN